MAKRKTSTKRKPARKPVAPSAGGLLANFGFNYMPTAMAKRHLAGDRKPRAERGEKRIERGEGVPAKALLDEHLAPLLEQRIVERVDEATLLGYVTPLLGLEEEDLERIDGGAIVEQAVEHLGKMAKLDVDDLPSPFEAPSLLGFLAPMLATAALERLSAEPVVEPSPAPSVDELGANGGDEGEPPEGETVVVTEPIDNPPSDPDEEA